MSTAIASGGSFTGLPSVPALDELKTLDRWVVWRTVPREGGGKPTKIPFMPGAGFRASIGTPAHWSTYVVAERSAIQRGFHGVGIVLTEDDDLFAIDLDDCITDGIVAPWANEILELAETYAEVTPSGKGLRLFGRGDPPTIKADAVGVEIYSAGRYVTVTGWQFPGAPDTIGPAPKSVERLVARVEALKPVASAAEPAPRSYDNTRSIAELEELLGHIPAACSYHDWLAVLMALHRETGGSAEGLDLADRWSAGGGSVYAGRREIEAKWRSFRRDGVTGASIAELARQQGAHLSDIAMRHKIAALPPADDFDPDKLVVGKGVHSVKTLSNPGETPALPRATALDYPPGLVGHIARWIVSTSRKPQPALAIGAALTVVGTAAGRQFMGPTHAGTALYLLGLAPTGQGKDMPLKQVRRLMKAAGLGHHLGADEFMSFSAVVNTLKRCALVLCPMDEFGDFLRRVYDRHGSSHTRAIPKILRTMWSANFDAVATPEWAQLESITLHAPHLAILGVATHEQFYSALEGGAVGDGTLNRFVIVDGERRPASVDPPANPHEVPEDLAAALRAIYLASGEMSATMRGSGTESPAEHDGHVIRMAWADDSARQAWEAFRAEMEARADQAPEEAELVTRAAEIAVRIATTIAAGRDRRVVDADDVRYGAQVARQSAEAMIAGAAEYMAENEQEANWQRVARFVRDKGYEVQKRDIQRKMRHMRPRDLGDLLTAMTEAGDILCRIEEPEKGGHRRLWFRPP